jgi:hypothetical protein
MSKEAITKFFEMLDQDDALQGKCTDFTEDAVQRAACVSVIDFAARHGFEFTEDELRFHLENAAAEQSDQDLGQVAGGTVPTQITGPNAYSRVLVQFLRPGGRISATPIHLPKPRR